MSESSEYPTNTEYLKQLGVHANSCTCSLPVSAFSLIYSMNLFFVEFFIWDGKLFHNLGALYDREFFLNSVLGRLVPRSQKDPRPWVRWVQGLGPWWILDLARPFCSGTLETQDLKIVICRKALETQDLKILICSETLETQDLKILIVARPWKPRTLKFGYVTKPWTPRTQNLKILMSRDF